MPGEISGLIKQISGLVVLAGCLYLAKPASKKNRPATALPATPKETAPGVNPDLLQRFPPERLEAIKRKSLRRYKARQDDQWQRWLDSVSR
jgi:hypothetical protein